MSDHERSFHAAGYVFTWQRATGESRVRIEMWREDPGTRDRFWITVAQCQPDRRAAYRTAMALVAWVRSLEVAPRRSVQAQAVAESLALLADRPGTPSATPRLRLRIERRPAAA